MYHVTKAAPAFSEIVCEKAEAELPIALFEQQALGRALERNLDNS
jgi:hypothetical protein